MKYKPTISDLNHARAAFPALCSMQLDLFSDYVTITTKYGAYTSQKKIIFCYDTPTESYTPVLDSAGYYILRELGLRLPRLLSGIAIVPYIIKMSAGCDSMSIEFKSWL